jgi:hypothetical protein
MGKLIDRNKVLEFIPESWGAVRAAIMDIPAALPAAPMGGNLVIGDTLSDGPETAESLCNHLRRMADNELHQIDADRISRAAEIIARLNMIKTAPALGSAKPYNFHAAALEPVPTPTLGDALELLAGHVQSMDQESFFQFAHAMDKALETHDPKLCAAALAALQEKGGA